MIKKGFTLVELLVVMGVLAVLASGLIVAINPADKILAAKDAKVQNDIAQISGALTGFAASHGGNYPCAVLSGCTVVPAQTSAGLNALVDNGDLKVLPVPPVPASTYGSDYTSTYTVNNAALPTEAKLWGREASKRYQVNATTPGYRVWCSWTASVIDAVVAPNTTYSGVCQ